MVHVTSFTKSNKKSMIVRIKTERNAFIAWMG